MKANQHSTPGPWDSAETAGHNIHGQAAVYSEATGKDIAIVYDGAANAKLIATAPELAQALKAIIAALTQPVQTSSNQGFGTCTILRADAAFAVKTAQAALAKAE